MNSKYESIKYLPHHVSDKRPHMSMHDRAAQFSPFAALTGYDDAVAETARLTDSRYELSDYELEVLNAKLNFLRENIDSEPTVTVRYFEPDAKKDGGAYLEQTGNVRKVRDYEQHIVMEDGLIIPFSDIYDLSGDFFRDCEFD